MKRIISACVLATLFAVGGAVFAAPAPHASSSSTQATALAKAKGKKVTVTCGDGTVYTGKHPKRGCKKHGGVKS